MSSNSSTIEFDRVVDAGADLGWDGGGDEPIDDSLPIETGTRIDVPPGTYRATETQTIKNLERFGIVGLGDQPEDVRFVGPEGKGFRWLNIRSGHSIHVENVAFDCGDAWAGSFGNAFKVADGLLLKDVRYLGKTAHQNNGGTSLLPVYITDPDGEGIIDGLDISGPADLIKYPENPIALYSGPESKGVLYVRNSRFENRGSHGIYASRCEGDVRLEKCTFKNNQNTHARISGEGSWAKSCRFIWDLSGHPNRGEFDATTGLTFESGFQGFAGGLVEGCEFICRSSANNSGCLKVDGSHGAVTVRNCRFVVDADEAEPIWVDAPGDSHMIDGQPAKPWDIQIENVTVEGDGGWESHDWQDFDHSGAVTLSGRSGSTVRGGRVAMSNRDGLLLRDGEYRVSGVAFDCGGEDVRTERATVTRDSGDDSDTDEETPMPTHQHTLSIDGTGTVTTYQIDVSGAAALGADATPPNGQGVGETVTAHEDKSSTLSGIIKGGTDSFRFDGEVTDVRLLSGPAPTITVDGTALDLSQFREDDSGEEGESGNGEPSGGDSGDGSNGSNGTDGEGLTESRVRELVREELAEQDGVDVGAVVEQAMAEASRRLRRQAPSDQ